MLIKLFCSLLALALVAYTVPTELLARDLLGAGFERFTGIPRSAARELSNDELDDLRGGFLGFFFEVTFSGFVQPGGVMDANLTVDAGLADASGGQVGNLTFGSGGGTGPVVAGARVPGSPSVLVTNPTTGESFRVGAFIDGNAFAGANAIAQISQVPGNFNDIRQALVINLAVLNVRDTDVAALSNRLTTLFGR